MSEDCLTSQPTVQAGYGSLNLPVNTEHLVQFVK